MDRPTKKRKPNGAPDWVINPLKGLLLFLLFWNINKQFPNGLFMVPNQADTAYQEHVSPYIEEISFNQLLSTTKPKINHFMKWGNKKISFLDPEVIDETPIAYQVFSETEFAKIWVDSFTVEYKGHVLRPNKVNAIFIRPDSTSIICEDENELAKCFHANLSNHQKDFALWLSIETEEKKTFFTKIKVTDNPTLTFTINDEIRRHWKKLINRDKHKSIDNLTVVKPLFQDHKYLFKWGDWERYAHGPRGGRRVKLGIKEFQSWINHQPFLYKDQDFVPFSMSINHWNQKNWHQCWMNRPTEAISLVTYNEDFREIVRIMEVGHTLSIHFFIKGDFIKNLSTQTLSALPGFIFNDEYIRFSIPIEIVEENFNPNHAPLNLTTSTFSFQLNSSLGENAIVKMDKNDPKNKALFKHYAESKSAEVVHVEDYKTIRRIITQDDIFIKPSEIEHKYTLPDKVFKTETFPEFYDFNIQPPLIKLKGLSTVLDKTTYDLKAFQKSKEGFEFYIGEEQVKLLQVTFTVVPKEGKAIQYITNNFTRNDIQRRLNKIEPETSLYFDKILFERVDGEQMVFPLTTALHLK